MFGYEMSHQHYLEMVQDDTRTQLMEGVWERMTIEWYRIDPLNVTLIGFFPRDADAHVSQTNEVCFNETNCCLV